MSCAGPLEAPAPAARTPTPQPSPALPAPFAGGRYEVKRSLGEGGRKRVFLAQDTGLDRDVAFSLIKTEGLDAAGLARVRREAQAMGRLGSSLLKELTESAGDIAFGEGREVELKGLAGPHRVFEVVW